MVRLPFGHELYGRYGMDAPRYSAYPTENMFLSTFDESDYKHHAALSNERLLPRDLSLYIHLPFAHVDCANVDHERMISQDNTLAIEAYFESLYAEIAMHGKLFDGDRLVSKIIFGGGTPGQQYFKLLEETMDEVAGYFHLDRPSNVEFSIRIDPRTINACDLSNLAMIGFRKFNLCGQAHPVKKNHNSWQHRASRKIAILVKELRDSNATCSLELITDLPEFQSSDLQTLIKYAADYGVPQINLYNLLDLPRRIQEPSVIIDRALPEGAERIERNLQAREYLLESGYRHLGLDCFVTGNSQLIGAQDSHRLRLDMCGYTITDAADQVGIGAGASSQFETAGAVNSARLAVYRRRLEDGFIPIEKGSSLNHDDRLRAAIIQRIMCGNDIDLSKTVGHYGDQGNTTSLLDYFRRDLQELEKFIEDELLVRSGGGFKITEKGRYFLRQIAAVFDRYQQGNNDSRILKF